MTCESRSNVWPFDDVSVVVLFRVALSRFLQVLLSVQQTEVKISDAKRTADKIKKSRMRSYF